MNASSPLTAAPSERPIESTVLSALKLVIQLSSQRDSETPALAEGGGN
ncbi:hypothetical protein ES703_00811 [subsurface metagenome]